MSDLSGLPQYTGTAANGMAQFGSDGNMFVFFYVKSVPNEAKSREAGIRLSDNVDYVHIQHPGERDFAERPARDSDKQRWPQQWQAFAEKRDQIPDGTPVDVLFPDNPSVVDTLKYLKIHTVQQLAGLSGPAMDRIGLGATEWKQKAEKYLAAHKDAEVFNKMTAELAKRDDQIEILTRQNAQMLASLEAMQKSIDKMGGDPNEPADPVPVRRGPGRPPKAPFEM